QNHPAANCDQLLTRQDFRRKIIACEYERISFLSQCRGAEKQQYPNAKPQEPSPFCFRGFALCAVSSAPRRCRATSYIITPPATETFREGTLPIMGIETTKSHFRRTKSCNPAPSAPSTMAQFMR